MGRSTWQETQSCLRPWNFLSKSQCLSDDGQFPLQRICHSPQFWTVVKYGELRWKIPVLCRGPGGPWRAISRMASRFHLYQLLPRIQPWMLGHSGGDPAIGSTWIHHPQITIHTDTYIYIVYYIYRAWTYAWFVTLLDSHYSIWLVVSEY